MAVQGALASCSSACAAFVEAVPDEAWEEHWRRLVRVQVSGTGTVGSSDACLATSILGSYAAAPRAPRAQAPPPKPVSLPWAPLPDTHLPAIHTTLQWHTQPSAARKSSPTAGASTLPHLRWTLLATHTPVGEEALGRLGQRWQLHAGGRLPPPPQAWCVGPRGGEQDAMGPLVQYGVGPGRMQPLPWAHPSGAPPVALPGAPPVAGAPPPPLRLTTAWHGARCLDLHRAYDAGSLGSGAGPLPPPSAPPFEGGYRPLLALHCTQLATRRAVNESRWHRAAVAKGCRVWRRRGQWAVRCALADRVVGAASALVAVAVLAGLAASPSRLSWAWRTALQPSLTTALYASAGSDMPEAQAGWLWWAVVVCLVAVHVRGVLAGGASLLALVADGQAYRGNTPDAPPRPSAAASMAPWRAVQGGAWGHWLHLAFEGGAGPPNTPLRLAAFLCHGQAAHWIAGAGATGAALRGALRTALPSAEHGPMTGFDKGMQSLPVRVVGPPTLALAAAVAMAIEGLGGGAPFLGLALQAVAVAIHWRLAPTLLLLAAVGTAVGVRASWAWGGGVGLGWKAAVPLAPTCAVPALGLAVCVAWAGAGATAAWGGDPPRALRRLVAAIPTQSACGLLALLVVGQLVLQQVCEGRVGEASCRVAGTHPPLALATLTASLALAALCRAPGCL